MTEFITDVTRHTFLQYALLTGILVSIASGIVGSYVTVRHIVAIAGPSPTARWEAWGRRCF
ncbi:MAG: hypothetical protein GF331_17495 [Chitinivibrionales bacterium]|nr:hypothetical protein [Chitinivibrionales bacterium]